MHKMQCRPPPPHYNIKGAAVSLACEKNVCMNNESENPSDTMIMLNALPCEKQFPRLPPSRRRQTRARRAKNLSADNELFFHI